MGQGGRIGGHVVVESLERLGAEIVFGLPGIHALPIWEALRTSPLRAVAFRNELNAGFAADGYARSSGRPAPLLLSTGPGALVSLCALMEAASSHVPVLAIASQIPADLIGRGRGYLHELPDQLASFAPLVRWAARAETAEAIPRVLAEAWRRALGPPSGPVFVEIPTDVLAAETAVTVGELYATPPPAEPGPAAIAEAAALLSVAERPAIWAGSGVLRAGAWDELRALAELLDAPVVTTFMGKGAIPEDHPLAVGSGCDEGAVAELLEDADVVLVAGSELGAETTRQYAFAPRGRLVQIDADPARIGATWPALAVVGDAKAAFASLAAAVAGGEGGAPPGRDLPYRGPNGGHPTLPSGADRAAAARARVAAGLAERGPQLELELLATIRAALPREAIHAWDMTILAYCASAHFPALAPRRFLYPLGSGTLGYAWPAALGARLANPGVPTLAVAGDGGIHYGLSELATARQHGIAATLLVVDDGAYGILREYQLDAFGVETSVALVQPDFVAVGEAFGVPARRTSPERLGDDLAWALGVDGPSLLVLPARLSWVKPTP